MEELRTITIGEGDNRIECEVVTAFTREGANYIALMPLAADDNGETEIEIFRYIEVEGGIELITIGDDGEYEAVSDMFNDLMETEGNDDGG